MGVLCSSEGSQCSSLIAHHKLFANILDHNVIRHFTLLTLLIFTTHSFRVDSWPNLDAILRNERVQYLANRVDINGSIPHPYFPGYHDKLLNILNDYFDGSDKIPDGKTINLTYQKVLCVVKQEIRNYGILKSLTVSFFPRMDYPKPIESLHYYLNDINNLLKKHQTVPLKHDLLEIEALYKTIDQYNDHKPFNAHS